MILSPIGYGSRARAALATLTSRRRRRPVAALVHLDRLTPRELRALERNDRARADGDEAPS
jgi:hypothetical protein